MKLVLLLATLGTYALVEGSIDCGRTPIAPDENLIVGGKLAKPFSWAWQALICMHADDGDCHIRCGASIIDQQWVMTSGHCVAAYADQPQLFGIKAGTFNYHDDYEPSEQEFEVLEVHLHQNYSKPVKFAYDLALLKVDSPFNFSKEVQPVCVPTSVSNLVHKGKSAYVTGWGSTFEGGPVSAKLRQAVVPFLDMSACEAEYPGEIHAASMECAGRKGVDFCQDDQGGPLVTKHPDTDRWFQAGIVSWERGCAESRYAGVFAKPSSMCDFIEGVLKKKVCRSS